MKAGNSRAKMAVALATGAAALLMTVAGAPPAAAQVSFVEPVVAPPIFFSPPGNGQEGVIGVAKGDFNGDGILDLAVTKDGGDGGASVMVMLGNGDGTFQDPLTMPLPPGMNVGMLLAKDFDGDGNLDLMVVVSGRQVFFYKGRGDGTFADPVAISTAGQAIGIQAADLNGDGKLDLVAANNADRTVTVLPGNGDGTFQTPAVYTITGSNPQDLAIGDIDGVNGPDIVVGCFDSRSIDVLLNRGDGTFPSATTSFNARLFVRGLYLADFDMDGKLDVVVTGDSGPAPGGFDIGFIKGNGDGTFQPPPDQNFQAVENLPGRRFSENVAPDLNGDGLPDILITHEGGQNFVTVGLGLGNGRFTIQEWVASPGPGFSPDRLGNVPLADGNMTLSVVPGDFNGDGLLDLAVASVNGDRPGGLSILLGTGPTGGSFAAPLAFSLSSHWAGGSGVFGASGAHWLALRDFNNDGKIDAFAVTTSPAFGGSLDFVAGRGDGTFGSPVQTIIGGGCPADDRPPFAPPIRAADINQDGNLDVVMLGFLNIPTSIHCVSGIAVAYGNGDGTFNFFKASARSDWVGGYVIQNFIAGDFNGDGKLDLAVLRFNGGATLLEVYLWPFNTHIETIDGQDRSVLDLSYSFMVSPGNRGNWAIAAGDFDNDGKLDLVVHSDADGGPERLVFFKGNGDGAFQSTILANAGFNNIQEFKAADLNRDGKLDLVGVSGRFVSVALGNGDGTFQPPVGYDLAPQSLVPRGSLADIVDLDGDGNLDLTIEMQGAGLAVLPGKGDGTFGTVLRFAAGDLSTQNVNVADLNGDGKPDLVVGRVNSADLNFLTVLINNSAGPAMAPLGNANSTR